MTLLDEIYQARKALLRTVPLALKRPPLCIRMHPSVETRIRAEWPRNLPPDYDFMPLDGMKQRKLMGMLVVVTLDETNWKVDFV